MVLTSVLTVSASDTTGWTIPKGFPLGSSSEITPVTASVDAGGLLHVSNGGWYTDGTSWGGAVSDKKYKLDGLKVEVEFSAVSASDDRWVSIDFLEKPDIFKVKDIKSNRGYATLIRPKDKDNNSSLNWQHYELLDKFNNVSNQPVQANFEKGLKLTMEVKKDGDNYAFYLNGVQSNYAFLNFNDIFTNGEAYVVVAASGKIADKDAYQYTVKVTTGNTNIPSITPTPIVPDKPATTTPTTPVKPTTPTTPVTPVVPATSTHKVGDVIDHVLNTDIVAYVNSKAIKSYNINGNTAVLAEDLMNYGFNVTWNQDARTLDIKKGDGTITSTYAPVANTEPVGSVAMDVLYTDIVTSMNGEKITSYNVNGSTIVYIDDLSRFGTLVWDADAKTISFKSF